MPKIKDTCRTIIILSWSCFYQFSSFLLSFFQLLCPFSTWIQITLSYLLTFPPSLTLSASPLRPVCQCWECLPSPGDSSCQSACTNPRRTGWINNNLLQPVISWRRKSRREEGKEREWKDARKMGAWGRNNRRKKKVEVEAGGLKSQGRNGNMSQSRGDSSERAKWWRKGDGQMQREKDQG